MKNLITAGLLICTIAGHAQTIDLTYRPVAIFVMLNSEQNRINKATKANWRKELEETKRDAAEVMRVTKDDFRDHYKATPVYYFIDTNRTKVIAGQLDGIIQKEDGSIATDFPRSRFLVVWYGYADPQKDPDVRMQKGLVIDDDKMRPLTKGSIYRRYTNSRKAKPYYYNSKHFDINYIAIGKMLNKTMLRLDNGDRKIR